MTTLGQIAYEYHNRRNDEAPDWGVLVECLQARWEHTACHVAEAVYPTMETVQAEIERVKAELAEAKAEVLRYRNIIREMDLWVPPDAAKAAKWHERAGIGMAS